MCTIVSANYLARARVLMASVERHHPDWDRHVLLVDEAAGRFDPEGERFHVTEVDALALDRPRCLYFRYSILELNTAVKPPYLRWLFEHGRYDRVVYLDPDVEVHGPLTEVESALDAGALMCLTPHLLGRNGEGYVPTEDQILSAGVYNLGFIALGRHPRLFAFLDWWWEKLEHRCVVDVEAGLFVDQKWLDLAPSLFGDVHVVDHPGYNVAYWNLGHRRVTRRGSAFAVLDRPLVFLHWSGFDPLTPDVLSSHQTRVAPGILQAVRDLMHRYAARLEAAGEPDTRRHAYAYGAFEDGTPIVDEIRRAYRGSASIRRAGGEDPFRLGVAYFDAPADGRRGEPLVTRLAAAIWAQRADLRRHFPDPLGAQRGAYARWFVDCVSHEHRLPPRYTEAMRASLLGSAGRGSGARTLRSAARGLALRLKPVVAPILPQPARALLKPWVPGPPAPRRPTPPPASRSRDAAPTHRGFFAGSDDDRVRGRLWMGARGEIDLAGRTGKRLSIEGHHEAARHVACGGTGVVRLVVTLGGRFLDEILLADEGPFAVEVELPAGDGPAGSLRLSATATFAPDEASDARGGDDVERSVRIARVRLDEHVLVDFAASAEGGGVGPAGSADAVPGINLIGYFRQDLGVGESVRLATRVAAAGGIAHRRVEFSAGCSSPATDDRFADGLSTTNPHPINVFHVNADQMSTAHEVLGGAFFDEHYNVGVWHWELPVFPEAWRRSFDLVDEIWAPSRFIEDSLAVASPIPVVYMPHAVEVRAPTAAAREEFGLPDDAFLFLTMFDMHSVQARKNPEAVVEAFDRAFSRRDRGGVGLVVKVMNADSVPRDATVLRRRIARTPGVHLIDRALTRDAVYRLEAVCDAFVSLHRSEGFGLGLAECMALGKPVIATGWSGNTDFMDHTNSGMIDFELVRLERDHGPYARGQTWAEPDVDHAAVWMRRLVEDDALRERLAAEGRRTIETRHAAAVVARRLRARLGTIAARL